MGRGRGQGSLIPALDAEAMRAVAARQDRLTKPAGSLGALERLSVLLAGMTASQRPPLRDRVVFVLAGDHGVTAEGVSAYPSEVTPQMVANFLAGGAAINVLARAFGARVVVADLGVAADLPPHPQLRRHKVRRGSGNIVRERAMSPAQAEAAIGAGRELVRAEAALGLDVACTGDMGIGNTTPAAALVCHFTGQRPDAVVGRGTGVDDAGLDRKREAVRRALERAGGRLGPVAALAELGGLEIAGLCGVILECAARRVPVVLDGFISGAAALAAVEMDGRARDYMIAGHRSDELGHALALAELRLEPLLDLGLRLGEGTGAVLALPLVEASVRLLDEMATFEEAAVSEREP